MILKILLFPFKCLFKLIGFFFGKLFGFIPPIRKNMDGLAFEQYVQILLQQLGYKHVHLTNNQDYGIDITAYKKKVLYGFQCKLYSKPVGVSAVQQVVGASAHYGCDRLVVVTNNTFTKQAKVLAVSNEVELWDGTYLNRLRHKANARGLFRRNFHEDVFTHPYLELLNELLNESLINVESIQKYISISDDKADYLLDDFEFMDLVSPADHYGMRERLYHNREELIEKLKQNK